MLGAVMVLLLTIAWCFDEELNSLEGGPALAPGPLDGDES